MIGFFKNKHWIIVLYAIIWLLITSILFYSASWQNENELQIQKDAFELHTLKLSEVAEQIVVNKIQRVDETLLFLRESILNDRSNLPMTVRFLRHGPLADDKLLVMLIDRDGYLSYTDAPDVPHRFYVGDQPYFRFFSEGGKDQLYVDEPRFGRITRRYSLPLVRPIFDKKGDFDGVIAMSIDQETLGKFGDSLETSNETTMTIVTQAGTIVSRSQKLSEVQGKSLPPNLMALMPEGANKAFWDRAVGDDMARAIAFQQLKNLPLTIVAESYPREIVRESAHSRRLILGSAWAASLLILILIVIFEQRRRVVKKYIATQQAHLLEAQRLAEMGSWELDLKKRRLKGSGEVSRLFGFPPGQFELDQEDFVLLVIESDRPGLHAAMENAIATGQAGVEYSIRRGDGELRLMVARAEAVRDTAGHVTSLIGTVRDITEQRNAERALQLSEAKMRTIADNVSTVMFMKDVEGRYLFVNRQHEKLFHINNADIQGKTDYDLYPPEIAEALTLSHQAVIKTGQPLEIEEMLPLDDGMHFYLSSKFPIRHATGEIYAICGLAVDITERKQSELQANMLIRRNEVLMHNSIDGIHVINEQGQLLEANDAFCRLLGYTQNEIIQLNISAWVKPSSDEINQYLEKTLNEGHAVFETVFHRKDGGIIEVEVSTASVDIVGDQCIYAAARDISERKRNQQHLEVLVDQRTAELRVALDAAKMAERAKDAFLANITHELRTPLGAVIGFTGLARPLSTSPKQSEYLDKVNMASKTLFSIINDLLDLSKISAGHMELEVSSFSLKKLVSRCISTISYKIEENNLGLVSRIDNEVPDLLCGDALRIEQILLNLLSNAAKFTAIGQVELNVGLQDMIGNRICLCFEVKDTGIGMDEMEIAQLFTPFSQADNSVSRRFGGTGLGLSICKRLAELMGGKISVSSHKGRGATFQASIWLTLGDASDLAANDQPFSPIALPCSYRDARVLVVDDQLFNREIVEGLLAEVGIAPCMAINGQDALDMLTYAGPAAFDLVFMDIQMPLLDGLSTTQAIRKLQGFDQLPIVAITAHTMMHERNVGREVGMSDHIGKPFEENLFYQMLAKWIPKEKHCQSPLAINPESERLVTDDDNFPALAGIDAQAGLALFVGDKKRYRHWLTNFVEEAPGYLAQIRQGLCGGQVESASAAIHVLKGRSGMLGMSELASIAGEIENALEAGVSAGELQDSLVRLDRLTSRLCNEIRSGLRLASTPVN